APRRREEACPVGRLLAVRSHRRRRPVPQRGARGGGPPLLRRPSGAGRPLRAPARGARRRVRRRRARRRCGRPGVAARPTLGAHRAPPRRAGGTHPRRARPGAALPGRPTRGGQPGMTDSPRRRLTAEERRDQLLDMAAELLVSEDPESVTMELVAERCRVSRPLVYKHFANRDELLGELYRREARRLDAELANEVAAATSIEEMFSTLVRGALRAADERG